MTVWDSYPDRYRSREVKYITDAVKAGSCVSIVGLSGSGKSNLVGFITHRLRIEDPAISLISVDCNRLVELHPIAFYQLITKSIGGDAIEGFENNLSGDFLQAFEACLSNRLRSGKSISLVFDRFDILVNAPEFQSIASNLRAVRDAWKYQLTYVSATRRPLDDANELAELFFGHTFWLGPLDRDDAIWSLQRDAARYAQRGELWSTYALDMLIDISGGYPSLLRACSEAYAAGENLNISDMRQNEGVKRRLVEFWADEPSEQMLIKSGILGLPLFTKPAQSRQSDEAIFDTSVLTAKENILLAYLMDHNNVVCEKDDLIRAVWPEDVIYEQGVRDDSLAQLVRRLRKKIELEPGDPKYIHTVSGRGYLFRSH